MFKNILFKALYILAFLVMAANTCILTFKSLNPDINDLPKGDIITSYRSPNGRSRIDIYLVKNNLGTAVRGEYVTDDLCRNIYWQTGTDTAKVMWLSEKSIIIDSIPLNVKTDKFDSRRGTAIFSEGVLAKNIGEND